MTRLRWALLSIAAAVLGIAFLDSPQPATAQGCTSTFCWSVRKSTGVCDVPDLYGCNCACRPPKT
jgi:hypothetical protein